MPSNSSLGGQSTAHSVIVGHDHREKMTLVTGAAFPGIAGMHTAQVNESAQAFAADTGTQELAIACTLLMPLVMKYPLGLGAAMLLATLANGFDVVHALLSQRWFQVPGALILATVYLAAGLWLFNRR
jgi:hypothetical protein